MTGTRCTIYKGSRRKETYLYVDQAVGLEQVPDELLDRLGPLSEVMTLRITPERKLARVEACDVLADIAEKGYFLQLPPSPFPGVMTMTEDSRPFWERKSLDRMSRQEWESLCDGCGKCCLHKLEDVDSGEVHYTRVACRYLEQRSCRCTVYEKRRRLVPACVQLTPGDLDALYFMPATCAYRLLHEGKPLPRWHPLVAGNRRAMEDAGHSVTGKVISEEYVHEDGMEEHIVRWVW